MFFYKRLYDTYYLFQAQEPLTSPGTNDYV